MKPRRLLPSLALCSLVLWGAATALASGEAPWREGGRVQDELNQVTIDLYGKRPLADGLDRLEQHAQALAAGLDSSEASALWQASLKELHAARSNAAALPAALGHLRGSLQHVLALEMGHAVHEGDFTAAKSWRSYILLPKYADAVPGALALRGANSKSTDIASMQSLLAREYINWQNSRIRESTEALHELEKQGRLTGDLLATRSAEILALATYPTPLLHNIDQPPVGELPSAPSSKSIEPWKESLMASLPQALTERDIERNSRLLLKLLRLVPFEYNSGVRDGKVIIPIEYTEAVTFTRQCLQLVHELDSVWNQKYPAIWPEKRTIVFDSLNAMAADIDGKKPNDLVEDHSKNLQSILQDDLGLSLRRSGKASEVVSESALEVRTLLTQVLAAAREERWGDAERLRLEAYTTFDLEIEARVLPRNPDLAIQAENSFLGGGKQLGIKAALDARAPLPEVEAAIRRSLNSLDACTALLRVGLSPFTVAFTSFTIVAREGLEAVVILAALLAGFRGDSNRPIRRRLAMGATLALVASGITFVLSHTLLQSLSRYGELLEAVVSLLAVIVLLMVTNWVFHKYYWVEWNARLRSLSRKVETQTETFLDSLAMVGVGFLTIYREGFETTLFMQSLILEGGWKSTTIGLLSGIALIGVLGALIFLFGKKMPYRKLLVVTGLLVVSILLTFLGSTVRLMQTVGWLPIHPIHGLEIPTWMGTWLGLYPSWEGMIIPFLGLSYVAGAWLWIKWTSRKQEEEVISTAPAEAHSLAK